MNEILQKRIIDKANAIINFNLVDLNDLVNRHDLFKMLIEITDFVLSHQWISVDEELPQDNKVVFYKALSEKGTKCYGSAYVFNKEWYSDIDSAAQDYYHYKITHWMPIPEMKGGEE